MNELALAILATLLWLTGNHHHEPEDVREGRLWPIAVALAVEGRDLTEISDTIAQGFGESRFKDNVQFGRCREGTCDPDSHGTPRAHGPFQAHRIKSRPELVALWRAARSDAYAATVLELRMKRELFRCGGNRVHSLSAHDGKGCRSTARGESRASLGLRIRERLRRELAK